MRMMGLPGPAAFAMKLLVGSILFSGAAPLAAQIEEKTLTGACLTVHDNPKRLSNLFTFKYSGGKLDLKEEYAEFLRSKGIRNFASLNYCMTALDPKQVETWRDEYLKDPSIILVDFKKSPRPAKKEVKPEILAVENVDAKPTAARPEYVEVPGPNGTMRLSPEVAARNKAAADEYARKMQEHSEAVARAKADELANAERHAQSVARAAEEKRAHDRRLADHAAQVAANEASAKPSGGNAIYRGFLGKDCDHARRVALGKGSFVEVATEVQRSGTCIVQGWWTANKSAAPSQ